MALRRSKVCVFQFDEAGLSETLDQLPPELRVAFAAACAERMTIAYVRFTQQSDRGDPTRFHAILNRLWEDLSGDSMSASELDRNIEASTELIDSAVDGPWIEQQAAGEDGAAALAYALRCRRSHAAQEAAWAARRAYAAIDEYVIDHEGIDTNDPGDRMTLLSHPLIQAELARQDRDVGELQRGTISIPGLRERAKAESELFLPTNIARPV